MTRSSEPDAVPATDPTAPAPRSHATPRMLQTGASWGWRFLVVVAAVLVTGWLLIQLRVVLIPVFVAVIFAALLTPLVDLFDRKLPRLLAVWVVLIVGLAATVALIYFLQAPVRSAIDELASSWDSTRADIKDWLRTGPLGLEQSQIDSLSNRADTAWRRFTRGLYDSGSDAARLAAEVLGGIFLAFVLTFFFLKDGRSMWQWALDRISPVRRDALDRGGCAAFKALQGWIRGVAITGVVDGVLIGAALLILGVPAAIPLAVITFFAAFFPIVGATLAGALATAIALATQGPRTAVIVALVVLIVQQVEGDVLLPIIMYRQVALHPVVVLLALAVGGAIGGILGAIVSVPTTAAISAFVAAARNGGGPDTSTESVRDGADAGRSADQAGASHPTGSIQPA
ncbi:MAG: AI-2E family transporter [Ilumatobacter sp.]|nr:AI-2E family transporter [Ilumatobacter sp.]